MYCTLYNTSHARYLHSGILRKQGPQAAQAMANRILNMPIAVTNCHNDLHACWFQSTDLSRHVCSRLFVRSDLQPTGWRQGHGLQPTARAMAKTSPLNWRVLWSAWVERFTVSGMWDFCYSKQQNIKEPEQRKSKTTSGLIKQSIFLSIWEHAKTSSFLLMAIAGGSAEVLLCLAKDWRLLKLHDVC